jgi:hypothetical protein
MDKLSALSRGTQLTLVALVLYVIDSFLPWESFDTGPISVDRNLWHGVGVIAVLLALAMLVWEVLPLFATRPEIGTVHPRLISLGLGALLVLFTLIAILGLDLDTTIWAWIGLILSVVATVGAFMEARTEGVEIPGMAAGSRGAGSTTTAAPPPPPTTTAPPPPPPAEEPPPEDRPTP